MGSILGFAEVGDTLQRSYRTKLMDELKLMKFEYDALMYGGRIDTVVGNTPQSGFAYWDKPSVTVVVCHISQHHSTTWSPCLDQLLIAALAGQSHTSSQFCYVRSSALLCLQAENLIYDVRSPAAAFANQDFSNIFFLTTGCLRADQSKCYPESSTYYHITHQGLDAMVYRFIDEMTVFANLPDNMAFPNHTRYGCELQPVAAVCRGF